MRASLLVTAIVALVIVGGAVLRSTRSAGASRETAAGRGKSAMTASAGLVKSPAPEGSPSAGDAGTNAPLAARLEDLDADLGGLPRTVVDGLRDPSYRPRRGEVPLLSAAAERELLFRYRAIDSMTNKYHLGLVLSYGGGDQGASGLWNTLTNDYRDRKITSEEENLLLLLPIALGETATRSDRAFNFLTTAADPTFWQQHCGWQSPASRHTTVRRLTESTLKGLGLSGRPEALEVLLSIRTRGLTEWPGPFRAGVVDAAFLHAMVCQHGESYLSGRAVPDGDGALRLFRDWRASPDGRAWVEWAHASTEKPTQ